MPTFYCRSAAAKKFPRRYLHSLGKRWEAMDGWAHRGETAAEQEQRVATRKQQKIRKTGNLIISCRAMGGRATACILRAGWKSWSGLKIDYKIQERVIARDLSWLNLREVGGAQRDGFRHFWVSGELVHGVIVPRGPIARSYGARFPWSIAVYTWSYPSWSTTYGVTEFWLVLMEMR